MREKCVEKWMEYWVSGLRMTLSSTSNSDSLCSQAFMLRLTFGRTKDQKREDEKWKKGTHKMSTQLLFRLNAKANMQNYGGKKYHIFLSCREKERENSMMYYISMINDCHPCVVCVFSKVLNLERFRRRMHPVEFCVSRRLSFPFSFTHPEFHSNDKCKKCVDDRSPFCYLNVCTSGIRPNIVHARKTIQNSKNIKILNMFSSFLRVCLPLPKQQMHLNLTTLNGAQDGNGKHITHKYWWMTIAHGLNQIHLPISFRHTKCCRKWVAKPESRSGYSYFGQKFISSFKVFTDLHLQRS